MEMYLWTTFIIPMLKKLQKDIDPSGLHRFPTEEKWNWFKVMNKYSRQNFLSSILN
jgi:hypothetical protein